MAHLKVLPPLTLSQLAEQWIIAKAQEQEANERRVVIEAQLAERIPGPDEGNASASDDGLKVTVTRKYSRSIDEEVYRQVENQVPVNLIHFKPTLDLKVYRAIELANPATFKVVQKFVTVKPGKPSIKVEEVEG